jgi:hypothetical protein
VVAAVAVHMQRTIDTKYTLKGQGYTRVEHTLSWVVAASSQQSIPQNNQRHDQHAGAGWVLAEAAVERVECNWRFEPFDWGELQAAAVEL